MPDGCLGTAGHTPPTMPQSGTQAVGGEAASGSPATASARTFASSDQEESIYQEPSWMDTPNRIRTGDLLRESSEPRSAGAAGIVVDPLSGFGRRTR